MEQYNTSAKNIEEFWEKTIKREELCIKHLESDL